MSTHRFYQLDVFTRTPLKGNALAVFPDARDLNDQTMQALAREMNPSGRRRYDAEAILASLRQGEGIVCASGNGGITRSSDLHEWRNDLGAVSTRDPVKL